VRLGASGPGGSTRCDLAVLRDGAARPERHRQRRFAASSAPAELGEAAALGCMRGPRDGVAAQGGAAGFKKGKPGISGGVLARGSPGISAGDHGSALLRGATGKAEPTGGVGLSARGDNAACG
jgi:hypothetical protein